LNYVAISNGYTYPTRGYHPPHIPLSITTRNLPGSEYGLHYDADSPAEPYGLQTTPLSAHDAYSGYSVSDLPVSNGRSWPANLNTQRLPAAYSQYAEQETSAGYSTSHPQYPTSVGNRQPPNAADNTSSFNVVSLQYSLPNTATDRVLPNPMANANIRKPSHASTSNSNITGQREHPSGISGMPNHPHSGHPTAYASKSSQATWLPENAHETCSNSTQSVLSGTDLTAPPSSKASVATSSSVSETSPHAYLPTGTSPDASPTNLASTYSSTSSAYSSASSTRSVTSASGSHNLHNSASHHRLHGGSSHADFVIARQNSQANLYSFTRDPDPRDDRDGTLVNGEDYRPLPQSHPTRTQIEFARHGACLETRQPALLRQSSMHSIHSSS
jgi:hypothetical protein